MTNRHSLFICLVALSLLLLPHKSAAGVGTFVGGEITTEQTWTLAGSPYYLQADIIVNPGATLTIEPGVLVTQDESSGGSGITIYGRLLAQGTATQPITFTSAISVKGAWPGLSIDGTGEQRASARLDHVVVAYAGASEGNITIRKSNLTLTNSRIENSAGDGIVANHDATLQIADTLFVDNAGYAVASVIYGSDDATSEDPQFQRLGAIGNGHNSILLMPNVLQGAHLWEDGGIPYIVGTYLDVPKSASLHIEPGAEVRFNEGAGLGIEGTLQAIGEITKTITFTSASALPRPGDWSGIHFEGNETAPLTDSILENVIVEYGGNADANLVLSYATVPIRHSIIRYSGSDGIRVGHGSAGSVIEASQIVDNTGLGILNQNPSNGNVVLAANNWWGSPSGPLSPGQCNPGGSHSKVSNGVIFRPFLTHVDEAPTAYAANEAELLLIAPQRWFVPADGASRAWIKINLYAGNGHPLPGRTIRIQSTLGNVVDGGITNAAGETLAYVTSSTEGEARLTALLEQESCETARSNGALITFTPSNSGSDLLPDEAAPYINDGIEIDPEPVQQGITTTLRARITNPNPFAITVSGAFAYAHAGIGLVFGPISAPISVTIPANSAAVMSTRWLPPISGHFCVEFSYTWQAVGVENAHLLSMQRRGRAQRNLESAPASLLKPKSKDLIKKAQTANGAINDGVFVISNLSDIKGIPTNLWGSLIQDQMVGNILDFIFEVGGSISCALTGGEECGGWKGPRLNLSPPLVGTVGNLMEDPPRQDYDQIAVVETIPFTPLQSNATLSAPRAEALNQLVQASLDLTAKLFATVLSQDRYAGAVARGDVEWSARQVSAYTTHLAQSGSAMIEVADRLDALVAEIKAEGFVEVVVTADAYRTYQERLRTQDFSAQEREWAYRLGISAEGLEKLRLRRLALDPQQMAGSQLPAWAKVAAAYRALGHQLLDYPNFQIPSSVAAQKLDINLLARVFDTNFTVQVGNPLPQPALIELRLRRLTLPPDWAASVTPLTVTLQPGEEITATITIRPGAAAPQGFRAKLAVEGYVESTLLGGVLLEVAVPQPAPFDPQTQHKVYLPLTMRN